MYVIWRKEVTAKTQQKKTILLISAWPVFQIIFAGFSESTTYCFSVTKSHLDSASPWTAAHQASLYFTIAWSLLSFMSIKSVMLSNQLIICWPLLLLPSIFPSIRVFSIKSTTCIRCPKYWSFSNSPSKKYSGLISFRIDKFDLLAVQRTQGPSPASQFKSINSSVFCLLYGSILISIHDYW